MGSFRRDGRGRRGAAASVSSAASFPVQSGSLVARFDASQAGTVTAVANRVSSVTNLTGPTSSAVQATGANQPAYGLTTQNGLNTLDFSGARWLVATLPAGITDLTFQVVVKIGATTVGDHVIAGNASGSVIYDVNGGVIRMVDFTGGGGLPISFADLTVTATSAHVISYRRSGAAWDAWLNSTKSVNGASTTTNAVLASFPIGNDDAASAFETFEGEICELMLYNAALSDSDVLVNQAALKAKWGTP